MKKRSVLKNTFYAFILQFTNMVFPLITAPYISRVIGAEGLGKFYFSSTVTSCFTLIAIFGTTTYGVREVAKVRDDNGQLSKLFSEMLFIKIITGVLCVLIYLPCVFLIDKFSKEYLLFLVQGITLLLSIFSLDWFYQGIENYSYITIRSLVFKVISVIAIFMLINSKDDYVIYAAITVFALSFSNILNFFYARKFVKISFHKLNIIKHLKPLSIFFASSIVISVYVIIDQLLLGFFKTVSEVAYFARSKMFVNMGMSLSITISNVIMPRLNNYFITNKERYKELLRFSADIMFCITIPIATGIFVLAKWIMLLFGGGEFEPATLSLMIIAPAIIVVPIGTWSYQQRFLPLNEEKFGVAVQIVIAIASATLNILLIPRIGFVGAAISWVLAETIGMAMGYMYAYKKDGFRMFTFTVSKYFFAATVMACCIAFLQYLMPISWLALLLCVFCGAVSYGLVLLLLRDKVVLLGVNKIFKIKC